MPGVPTMFIGHPEPPAAQELRSLLAQILRLGWRTPAGGTEAKVRATDGLQGRGRLRPDRSLPQRHLQSRRGACEGGLNWPAIARHHRLPARPCRPQQGGRARRKGRNLRQRPPGDAGLLAANPRRRPISSSAISYAPATSASWTRMVLFSSSTASRTSSSARATTSIPAASRRRSTSTRAVEEVTVIGIKDEYRGEAPKAFIKLKAGSGGHRGRHSPASREQALQDRNARRNRIPRRPSQDDDRQTFQERAESRRGAAAKAKMRVKRAWFGGERACKNLPS